MTNIIQTINKDLDDFTTEEVVIADEYKFNQKETVKENLRLYHSQYKEGEFDDENFRKFFYNIVKNPCSVSTKAISFYPSDIQIIPVPGQDKRKAWLLDRDFKFWAKEKELSVLMRNIFESLPIYGSVVLKKVKDKLYFVDLRNLANEQSASNLQNASYVIEQHFMTPSELRKMGWDKEKKDEVLSLHRASKEPYIRVLEWRGEVPESEVKENGSTEEYVRAVAIVYSPQLHATQEQGIPDNATTGTLLHIKEEKEEDFPYREIHLERLPGRWLGIGKVEENRDPQIRTNEIVNLRVKASYFASLSLWQTRDNTVDKNLLHTVGNGDIIPVLSEITRIPVEERNLTAYGQEETNWIRNRDEISHSWDVIRGERLPAGTTLGAAQLAAEMTMSYFDGLRRKIAAQLKPIIKKDIIGDFLSERSNEHYLKLVGEDFDKWGDIMIAEKTYTRTLNFLGEKGKLPSKNQWDMIKSKISQDVRTGKESLVKIPKDYFQNLDYDIDIVITGQNRNIGVEAANVQMVLQAIQQDETLLTNPKKKRVFARLLDGLGLNISDFEMEEETGEGMEEMIAQKARGGGIGGGAAGATGLGRGGMQAAQLGPADIA